MIAAWFPIHAKMTLSQKESFVSQGICKIIKIPKDVERSDLVKFLQCISNSLQRSIQGGIIEVISWILCFNQHLRIAKDLNWRVSFILGNLTRHEEIAAFILVIWHGSKSPTKTEFNRSIWRENQTPNT